MMARMGPSSLKDPLLLQLLLSLFLSLFLFQFFVHLLLDIKLAHRTTIVTSRKGGVLLLGQWLRVEDWSLQETQKVAEILLTDNRPFNCCNIIAEFNPAVGF